MSRTHGEGRWEELTLDLLIVTKDLRFVKHKVGSNVMRRILGEC